MITAGGTNIAPSVFEDRVREHWLVAECVSSAIGGNTSPRWSPLDIEAFTR